LHESAFGYLLGGGDKIPSAELGTRLERLRELRPAGGDAHPIQLQPLATTSELALTRLSRNDAGAPLRPASQFNGSFERNWSVGSFTSLSRQTTQLAAPAPPPTVAQEATLLEVEQPLEQAGRIDEAPWHRFPRGSVPGNFLHEQLEWMAQDGFHCVHAANFDSRLAARIERAGWANRQQDAIDWLKLVATTSLPPLNAALADLQGVLPEMEFWFPSEHLDASALDRLCAAHLLDGVARPSLPQRQLHGMLKGFADLVFEHEGRYWVLDYKSNALGGNDKAYTRAAMAHGMAAHRYDIQGAIYMLALHRLLKSRLGDAYDPASQLGGAVFLFLRGIANSATRGCYLLAPDLALLDGIDGLLGVAEEQ
jgi:exodeoxyribonuclease V beta subunit